MTTGKTFASVCSGIEAASVAWHPLDRGTHWFGGCRRAAEPRFNL